VYIRNQYLIPKNEATRMVKNQKKKLMSWKFPPFIIHHKMHTEVPTPHYNIQLLLHLPPFGFPSLSPPTPSHSLFVFWESLLLCVSLQMKKICVNRKSITWNTEGCQVSRGTKQKPNGEHLVFFIIRGPCVNALSLVSVAMLW